MTLIDITVGATIVAMAGLGWVRGPVVMGSAALGGALGIAVAWVTHQPLGDSLARLGMPFYLASSAAAMLLFLVFSAGGLLSGLGVLRRLFSRAPTAVPERLGGVVAGGIYGGLLALITVTATSRAVDASPDFVPALHHAKATAIAADVMDVAAKPPIEYAPAGAAGEPVPSADGVAASRRGGAANTRSQGTYHGPGGGGGLTIYRWVNRKGVLQVTNSPPPEGTPFEKVGR